MMHPMRCEGCEYQSWFKGEPSCSAPLQPPLMCPAPDHTKRVVINGPTREQLEEIEGLWSGVGTYIRNLETENRELKRRIEDWGKSA